MRLPIRIALDRQRPLARLLCHGDIGALTLLADGRMDVERIDGTTRQAEVLPGTAVFTGLVILRLRMEDCVESLVLPCAATGRDAHRRLRVWLRWRASVLA